MALKYIFPVEIPMISIMFVSALTGSVTTNWLMYKSCTITLQINKTDCEKLIQKHTDNLTDELEKIVQPYVTTINMTNLLMESIFTAIICLFMGPWSDIYGRKPVLLLSSGAYTLTFLGLTIICGIPNISPWFLLVSTVPICFSGGMIVFMAANVCYMTDITTLENRGFRFGVFFVSMSGALVTGQILSSFALKKLGFLLVYFTCSVIHVVSFFMTLFFLDESVENIQTEEKFSNFFKLSHVRETMKVAFKKREKMNRPIILLIVIIMSVFNLCSYVISLAYLFVRVKFSWTLEHFTIYNSVRIVLEAIGSGLLIYIMNKLLKVNESIVATIGLVSFTLCLLWFGLCTKSWHIYTAGTVRCFSGAVLPMFKSLASKLVSSQDYGKLFAFISVVEAIIGPLGSPIFTLIYNKTLNYLPGAFYIVAESITFLLILLSLAIVIMQAKYYQKDYYYIITADNEDDVAS